MLDEKHLQRMRELIGEARSLSIGDHNDQCNGHHHQTECMAWLLSAAQITAFLVPNTENLYRKSIERLATARSNHIAHRSVAEVRGGPTQSDSISGLLSGRSAGYAASRSGGWLKYTSSGACRARLECGRRRL